GQFVESAQLGEQRGSSVLCHRAFASFALEESVIYRRIHIHRENDVTTVGYPTPGTANVYVIHNTPPGRVRCCSDHSAHVSHTGSGLSRLLAGKLRSTP